MPKRVGVIGTNQSRKDWGLAATVCATLVKRMEGNVRFWWHTDMPVRFWSIPALLSDFGLNPYVDVTYPPVDDQFLADKYRSCDVTLHPGLGEGFGYPIFESLACGVPAIHGDYAGGASIVKTMPIVPLLVAPRQWRLEGQHDCIRPVFDAQDWADKVEEILAWDIKPESWAAQLEHLDWRNLRYPWSRWFLEGIK